MFEICPILKKIANNVILCLKIKIREAKRDKIQPIPQHTIKPVSLVL